MVLLVPGFLSVLKGAAEPRLFSRLAAAAARVPWSGRTSLPVLRGPDETFPANAVVSERKTVEEATVFVGFES